MEISLSLLTDLQESVLDPSSELSPILLKLRYFASKLGSIPLEDWVRHECDGYPKDTALPDYRKLVVRYTATGGNAFQKLNEFPIPDAIIIGAVGKSWLKFEMRDSVGELDSLLEGKQDGEYRINANNLVFKLQNKIFDGVPVQIISGHISLAALANIRHSVKSHIMELLIQIEKEIPTAGLVILGKQNEYDSIKGAAKVTNIYQTVMGDYTGATTTGDNANVTVNIAQGNSDELVKELVRQGIPEQDAIEFTEIVKEEGPDLGTKDLGARAKEWLGQNISSGATDVWKGGIASGTAVLTAAAKAFFGV